VQSQFNQIDPVTLVRDFVRIPSLSGQEAKFAEHVEQQLQNFHWSVTRQPVAPNRWNLYATPENSDSPSLVFCTHLDTVAPHVEFAEDEEYLYGRGSCDAKGVMAAMIAAAFALAAEGYSGVGMLFTVGEEVDSAGAKAANELAPDSVRYTIVGEPTENRLVVGQKGIYIVDITTNGKAAHSAYPEYGDSAVTKLLDILERLRKTPLPEDPHLGKTTLNLSRLHGGAHHNVIPDSAGAGAMFRVSTSLRDVQEIVQKAVGSDGTVEVVNKCEPQSMVKVPGFEEDVVAFSTDIPYMTNWGKRVLFGPGSITDAHTLREKISKTGLREAVPRYIEIVRYLLSESGS